VLLWPLLGLWTLAVLQLVPLPEGLHHWLAPGSAAVWHPDVPAAAAVLGPGPHPISLYPEATGRWIAFATGVVALALAAAPALRDRRLLLRASISVVAGGLLVAVYGLVARLAFGDKLYGFLRVPTIAPFGPFVSKNHFAGYVEMAALLALGLAAGLADEARRGAGWLSWVESRRSKWVVIAWGAAFVLILAIPVSLSRGGVVSLSAGLLVFLLLRLRARRAALGSPMGVALALVAVLLGGATIFAVLPAEARARLVTLGDTRTDASTSYRLGLWRDTLRLVASSPVAGSGFGAFADALPRFKTAAGDLRIEHAENDWLELAAEGGLAGAALVGILAVVLAGLVSRDRHDESYRLAGGLRDGALAGALALFVHGVFDFNLHIPSNALMFVLLAAFALGPAGPMAAVRLPAVSLVVPLAALALAMLTPWKEPRVDAGLVGRAAQAPTAGLRRQSLETVGITFLRERPADARAWVIQGWLAEPESPADAADLAAWGMRLDPRHEALRSAAVRAGVRPLEPATIPQP